MSSPDRRAWAILAVLALGASSCGGGPPLPVRATPHGASSVAALPAATTLVVPVDLGEPVRSPLRLVRADGAALPLRSLRVSAEIADPVASTELVLVFDNADSSPVDGRLEMHLPPGAVVSRLAVRRATPAASSPGSAPEAAYDDATIVERARGKASYDDVLAARTEPELGPTPFLAHVGPTPASTSIEVVVSYHEALSRGAYRLPLRGLPKMAHLSARVAQRGAPDALAALELADASPTGDLLVPAARYRSPRTSGALGVSAGGLVAVRASVDGQVTQEAVVSPIFLCDTSASRALDLGEEVSLLRDVVAHLAPDIEIVVAGYDQEVAPIYEGKASGLDDKALEPLRARRGLGATDLSGALEWAGRTSLSHRGMHHRLVVFGDGAASAGVGAESDLTKLARDLGAQGIDRIDAVSFGATTVSSAFRAITYEPSLPFRGTIATGESGAEDVVRKLTHAVMAPIDVEVIGAKSWSPSRLFGATVGDDLVVLADVGRSVVPDIRVGTVSLRPAMHDGALVALSSLVGASQVDTLLARSDLGVEARRTAVVAVALDRHVPSPFTSFAFRADTSLPSPLAKMVALDLAWRGRDVELVDEPPPLAAGTDVFDPLDDRIQPSPHVEVVHTESPAPKPAEAAPEPTPRASSDPVTGRLPSEIVQRVVRLNHGRFRGCYERALGKRPKLAGRVVVKFEIDPTGAVATAKDDGSEIDSPELRDCVISEFKKLEFPAPVDGKVVVRYPLVFARDDSPPPPQHIVAVKRTAPPPPPQEPEPHFDPPYSGTFLRVMDAIARGDRAGASSDARSFQATAPDDVLAYVALGEAAEASHDLDLAARAYGSILELWPHRADLARFAGERLGRVDSPGALRIARDAFLVARADRPDHPTSHRLLAFAEYRVGRPEQAFRTLEQALLDNSANPRFVGARPTLATDLGLLGAAWARTSPERRGEIDRRTKGAGGRLETSPSLRAVLHWETNTIDVDLHVDDGAGDHASRKKKILPSGGELSAGVVDGYGPQLFIVTGARDTRRYPYAFRVVFPARGSLGFAAGDLQIVEHDGKGHLSFGDRPFVVENGRPGIELGELAAP